MKFYPTVRLMCLIFGLCMAISACTASIQRPPAYSTLRMDGYIVPVNQGDKSLTQEKFRLKYDCTVESEREVKAQNRTEKVREEISLGWGVNELNESQKGVNFRLYIMNPEKIVHKVTYFQKVDGKVAQEYTEPSDSIADFKTHNCKFPVLKTGKVVEFGARVDLYEQEKKTVYATIVADGFRYISLGDAKSKSDEKGGGSLKKTE